MDPSNPINHPHPPTQGADLQALDPPEGDAGPTFGDSSPRGFSGIAWVVIAFMCVAMIAVHTFDLRDTPAPEKKSRENPIDAMLFELQGKYIIAAAEMYPSDALLYTQTEKSIGGGTITQRQKFSVLANELAGPDEALAKLDHLEGLLQVEMESQQRDEPLMSPEQAQVQQALRRIYTQRAASEPDEPASADDADPAALTEDDRQPLHPIEIEGVDAADADPATEEALLVNELGWFGKLAISHRHPEDSARREEVLAPARVLLWFIASAFVLGAVAGVGGFVGLVFIVVFALMRKLRAALVAPGPHHGVYAETFAVWMVLFLALQVAAGAVSAAAPRAALPIVFVAFMTSLLALLWPVVCGLSWAQVKRDIGWHGGRSAIVEIGIGAGGYFMALPLLAIGLAITYVLILLQQALKPAGPLFEPPGGPAHPIIEQLTGPDWFPKIMVLALGAIAAPIVEETMFRGVLHGHLRGATKHWGLFASVTVSTLVNSFIFAAIHPQGWVAIPALMSLAIAFSLAREWRGSIIPPMMMHGMSNFIVMSLLITALTLSRSG